MYQVTIRGKRYRSEGSAFPAGFFYDRYGKDFERGTDLRYNG